MVKTQYRKDMFRRDRNINSHRQHKQFVKGVLEEVKKRLVVSNMLRGNKRYVDGHASLD